MNKSELWDQLIAHISSELEKAEKAARDAADYATDDEAKAKSKWDTQGLEASYLAAGQAKKVGELREAVGKIHALATQIHQSHSSVREGSLVTLDLSSETSTYLVVPAGGGVVLEGPEGVEIWTITPPSPLGQRLIGKANNASLTMPNKTLAKIISII
ncbi:MAG: transcription elongation factor GreAB [Verrucomicrobiota bacterium]